MFDIKPASVLIWSWALWFLFFLISPYQYNELGDWLPPVLLLLAYNVFFWSGLYSKKKSKNKIVPPSYLFTPLYNKLLNLSLILGLIGSILNIYAKATIIASISVESLYSNKEQLLDAGELAGGGISVISAFLYPMCYVSLIMLIFYRIYIRRLKFFIGLIISLLPVMTTVALGSRTILFFYGVTIFFAYLLSPKKKSSDSFLLLNIKLLFRTYLKRKTVLVFGSILFGAIFLFSVIQGDRLEQMGGDDIYFFEYWGKTQQWDYNYDHPINLAFKNNDPKNHVAVLNFIHYMVHGVFEYIRLYNHLDNIGGIYYGSYEGYIFFKFFNYLGFDLTTTYEVMASIEYKQAVYTTFWGPFFIDFGVYGVFLIFYFGRFIFFIYTKFIEGRFWSILCYPYALAIVFTSTVFHSFTGGFLYNVISIVVIYFLSRVLVKNEGRFKAGFKHESSQ